MLYLLGYIQFIEIVMETRKDMLNLTNLLNLMKLFTDLDNLAEGSPTDHKTVSLWALVKTFAQMVCGSS